jgi:outer membrane scaffolding protein for murein synthesis (MipA/OmpV family)
MIRPAVVLALSSLALSASAEDLTITFTSSDGAPATHYFSKDRIRMNSGKTDTIVEFASGKIVTIDNLKKEYSEMTVAEIDAAMQGMSAQMEQAMAQIPPQMRERMAGMMGGAAAEVTVVKGASRTVAGYPCQSYTITMGASMTQETCNTTALAPPFDPANFQKLTRVSIPMMQGMDKLVQKMSEIQGLALARHTTMSMMGRKIDTTMEATEVKKGAIPADVFAMPAGYKLVDSPLKKMPKMGGPR